MLLAMEMLLNLCLGPQKFTMVVESRSLGSGTTLPNHISFADDRRSTLLIQRSMTLSSLNFGPKHFPVADRMRIRLIEVQLDLTWRLIILCGYQSHTVDIFGEPCWFCRFPSFVAEMSSMLKHSVQIDNYFEVSHANMLDVMCYFVLFYVSFS